MEGSGEHVTLLSSELIFSSDSDARTLGMELLQEIQPGNAHARDIVSGMLATEVEPKVLIEALTALALALRNMPLSSNQGNALDELEAQINTVIR